MFAGLEIDAELTVSLNGDHFLIVAEENQVIVNFKDLKSMERVLKNAGTVSIPAYPGAKPVNPKAAKSSGGPFKQLNEVNSIVSGLKLIVDVRVGGKSYVVFGTGSSAKIKAAAIFGKIGSFFGK